MKIYFEQFKFIAITTPSKTGYYSIFIYGVKISCLFKKKKKEEIIKFSRFSINRNVRENLIGREQLYIQQKFSIISVIIKFITS